MKGVERALDTMNFIRFNIERACVLNGVPSLAREIKVEFSNKMTKCAGVAFLDLNKISLSKKLWDRASQEQRLDVVVHETCHLIVERLYGKDIGHGKEWQDCMNRVGIAPKRYHTIDRSGLVRSYKNYKINCKCSSFLVTKSVAMKYSGGGYYCKNCMNNIQYLGKK